MTRDSRTDAPNRREIAATWFLHLRGEKCSAADRSAFEAWESEPQNAAAYAAVEAAWALAGSGAETKEIHALLDQARRLTRRRLPWPGIAAAVAAAAVLGVAGTQFWSFSRDRADDAEMVAAPSAQPPSPDAANYSTAIGERSTVTLGDGSVVFLNTNSRLRADYSAAARNVVLLQGQALFEVMEATDRPFIVTAGDRRVTALGTTFDVRLEQDSFQVTLIEGRVRVEDMDGSSGKSPGGLAELEAGQQLIDSTTAGVEVREAPVRRVTSWREGRLIFEDEPLADAVAEMNRYSTTRILLSDPALERLRVSGVFKTGQTQGFVEALVAYFPIVVSPASAKDRIVLMPIDAQMM